MVEDIVPDISPTSPSLPKSDFDNLQSKMKNTNDNINNDIKALTNMTNKHQSELKNMNNNISAMPQDFTAANSKIFKHEEKSTEISSQLSDYEDPLNIPRIKDTQIQPLSIHITQLTDTSFKTDKHEEQLTEITSKCSDYEIRLDKLSTSKSNKIDTSIRENEKKRSTAFDKILMISKLQHLPPSIRHSIIQIHTTLILLPNNPQLTSLNGHFSSYQIYIHMLHNLPCT